MIMAAVAFLLGFILCSLFGVPYISMLKKRMIGQYIKDVAPENHAQKEGTPTTGGVFIVAAIIMAAVITLCLAQKMNSLALVVIITLAFYTFAGFQDDYIKIKGKGIKNSSTGNTGDMYLIFKVVTPNKLSREQRNLLEKLMDTDLTTSEIKDFNKFVERG